MTHRFLFVFMLLLASSCQFFETEKVSSEEIFNEEIKTINWKDVDRYPSFPNCENNVEKIEQQDCFINTISSHLYKSISQEELVAAREIYDTVEITFEVNSEGKLLVEDIKIDSLLQKDFPYLEDWILNSVDSLQPLAPAYKRGIPVKTKFKLPVIVQTN
ncbi:MAG TPA: hypothetical protein VKX34_03115 [Aequorivita sp.]|nr:hypothetical protein [Aequorivita sp.]